MKEVSEEKVQKEGQSLCQLYTWQGINFQITLKSQKTKPSKIQITKFLKCAMVLNREFCKEETKVAEKYVKKILINSLAIREM